MCVDADESTAGDIRSSLPGASGWSVRVARTCEKSVFAAPRSRMGPLAGGPWRPVVVASVGPAKRAADIDDSTVVGAGGRLGCA
jgi:hypothetical protein